MAAAQSAGKNSITNVLENICRERRREHLDKESEEGFIVLAIESFWTRLFSQYFVCSDDETRDDLLFYVKGKSANKDGKVAKEAESKIAVFRKDSKVLPRVIGMLSNFKEFSAAYSTMNLEKKCKVW